MRYLNLAYILTLILPVLLYLLSLVPLSSPSPRLPAGRQATALPVISSGIEACVAVPEARRSAARKCCFTNNIPGYNELEQVQRLYLKYSEKTAEWEDGSTIKKPKDSPRYYVPLMNQRKAADEIIHQLDSLKKEGFHMQCPIRVHSLDGNGRSVYIIYKPSLPSGNRNARSSVDSKLYDSKGHLKLQEASQVVQSTDAKSVGDLFTHHRYIIEEMFIMRSLNPRSEIADAIVSQARSANRLIRSATQVTLALRVAEGASSLNPSDKSILKNLRETLKGVLRIHIELLKYNEDARNPSLTESRRKDLDQAIKDLEKIMKPKTETVPVFGSFYRYLDNALDVLNKVNLQNLCRHYQHIRKYLDKNKAGHS